MDNVYYIMDSSDYARKYMKYKLKYKNLQKSIVQAGGNKYRIWDTGVVELVDMEKRIDTNMDEEDKKQLFEFIEKKEPENYKKSIEKKYKIVEIESAYVPIFKRSAAGSANPFDLSEYQCNTKDPESALMCLEKVIAHGKTEFSILSIGRIRTTLQDIERLPEATLTPTQKVRFDKCKQWAQTHRILPRKMQNAHFSSVIDTLPERIDKFLADRMKGVNSAVSQPAENTDIKTITLPNVGVYEGTLLMELPYKKGTMKYFNGDEYTGNFSSGQPNGTGTMKYFNGDEYTGNFVNGIIKGEGTYTFDNGDKYVGEYVDNVINGIGKYVYSAGLIYEGHFSSGQPNGTGTLKYFNGDEYTGNFVNGHPNGTGTIKYTNGKEYTGDFMDGHPNGTGILKYADGTEYTGKFVGGKIDGIGTCKLGADKLTGYFINGTIKGEGTYTFDNGDKYEGNFVNGVINGIGKYVYSDGIIYEGHFKNGDADVLRPIDTKISEPYSITLFINAHGCEIKDSKLPVIYPNIDLKYVNSTDFGCVNDSKSDRDIAYASVLFNTNTKTHIEAVKQYRKKKGRTGDSKHNREYNHRFQFGINITSEKPDNYDILDGIIIIQNTLGLPNNVNLFDFTKPDRINDSINEIITEFSRSLEHVLFVEDGYYKLVLSALLGIIDDWFSRKFQGEKIPGKKLILTIIDNSCRKYCNTDRIE